MKRVNYFESTLKQCEAALKSNPEMIPLRWVIKQLKYLISLEKGIITDCLELKKVQIGHIAVREMDGYEDKDLIKSLCLISNEVDKMLLERIVLKNTLTKDGG